MYLYPGNLKIIPDQHACPFTTHIRVDTRLIPKLFPGHVLGDPTFQLTSFVSQSPGTIADQWESEDLDRTTKTSDIGRKEFWYQPRMLEGWGLFKCWTSAVRSPVARTTTDIQSLHHIMHRERRLIPRALERIATGSQRRNAT